MTFRDRNPKPGRERRPEALAAVTSPSAAPSAGPGETATTGGAEAVQFTDRDGADQQWRPVPLKSVSEQVHTAGRVRDLGEKLQFSWPGVYFEG
ncbi:hypothetical protein ACFRH6_35835, partial [Streptomyces sp. NPDC056749]